MKVLHLFSNAKWTGPAEPALNLCVALRAAGVDADFACAPDAGESINKVVETARDRGIEPVLRFHLFKHRRPVANWLDARGLRRFVRERGYDLIHCHLDNDHRIARAAVAGLGIPIIRSSYAGEGFPSRASYAKLLKGSAFVIEPSRIAAEHDARAFGFPPDRMRVIPGAVDVSRFDPARETPDARRWLGIPPDAFVVGIVARMQTHRHYTDFFDAFRRLVGAHAIIVGRGTKQEQVGKQPVQELGIERHVHFPGYVDGENYVGMLKAFDVKVFLVPGTDGTCRAVREAMAMGKPAIVADRGMLREIVTDGESGIVCDGTPDALFTALLRLAGNRQETHRMGRAARERAVSVFSLEAQARAVRETYDVVLTAINKSRKDI